MNFKDYLLMRTHCDDCGNCSNTYCNEYGQLLATCDILKQEIPAFHPTVACKYYKERD